MFIINGCMMGLLLPDKDQILLQVVIFSTIIQVLFLLLLSHLDQFGTFSISGAFLEKLQQVPRTHETRLSICLILDLLGIVLFSAQILTHLVNLV